MDRSRGRPGGRCPAGRPGAVLDQRRPGASSQRLARETRVCRYRQHRLINSIGALDKVGDAVEYSHAAGSLNGRAYTSDLWVHRAAERQRLTGPGSADTAAWQTIANGTLTRGFIYYDSRTWTRYSSTAGTGWTRIARTPTAKLEANLLRYALASGRWTVTGHAVAGGQRAIAVQALESMPATSARAPAGTPGARPPAADAARDSPGFGQP